MARAQTFEVMEVLRLSLQFV